MRIEYLDLPGALLIEPRVHGDQRGFFMETWRQDQFSALGIGPQFVQDNHSRSNRGVLRGLHYQLAQPQGKLVRVVQGEIHDVIVDLRRGSETFGQWRGVRLSADNHHMLWVPPGFAHGFQVVSMVAEIVYKCTAYYAPQDEHCVLWNDPQLAIDWPLADQPVISEKDQLGKRLFEAEVYP